MSATDTQRSGDCFAVAAGFLRSGLMEMHARESGTPLVLGEKSIWRVCHGLPVGTSGPPKGHRYWHAWVEVTFGDSIVVLDLSNGKDIRVDRAFYYRLGQLDEAHVWRYSPAEAKALCRRHGHAGPWVPGWEMMEL